MRSLLLGLVLLVAAASAHHGIASEHHQDLSKHMDKELKANMNEYFDTLLAQLKIYMSEHGLVPMPLPDSKHGFSVKILLVTWHGELWLTKGSVNDLSTVTRMGDAELNYIDGKMIVRAEIGWDKLEVTYDYLAKIMDLGPDGRIHGRVRGMVLNVAIEMDTVTGSQEVMDMEVLKVGDLDVWLTGSIIMDLISNAIIAVFTSVFEDSLVKLIMAAVKDAINAVLANTSIPTPPPVHVVAETVARHSGGIVNLLQKVRPY